MFDSFSEKISVSFKKLYAHFKVKIGKINFKIKFFLKKCPRAPFTSSEVIGNSFVILLALL